VVAEKQFTEVGGLFWCSGSLRELARCVHRHGTVTVVIAKSPGEHQNEPPPSVNQFNTTSGCIYIEMEEVVEQGNAINLYYLIFLGMVILRPVLVTLGGGAWDDSPP
jgi:hypothetical protein